MGWPGKARMCLGTEGSGHANRKDMRGRHSACERNLKVRKDVSGLNQTSWSSTQCGSPQDLGTKSLSGHHCVCV